MKRLAPLFSLVLLGVPIVASGAGPVVAPSRGVAAVDPTTEARAVVESFHTALRTCMETGDEFGFAGRYDIMQEALDEAFDVKFMARTALGPTWKELPESEQADFIDQFRRLAASTYAVNFSSYDGEHFETVSQAPAARGTILVKTELVQPKGEKIRFSYLLREVDQEWRVIDVLFDGNISELALRRGQYRSKIESDGFPVLVQTLESRIDELAQN